VAVAVVVAVVAPLTESCCCMLVNGDVLLHAGERIAPLTGASVLIGIFLCWHVVTGRGPQEIAKASRS